MLTVVTVLWGMSFPLVKRWLNAAADAGCPGGDVGAILTLIAVRTVLALALLAVFQPSLFGGPTRREHATGLLIGTVNTLGFGLQVWGLTATSPALSAFITSLGSAWVPLLGLALFGQRVLGVTWSGLALALAGAAVLCGLASNTGWTLDPGELVTLACSFVFAVLIVMLDRLGRHVRPGHLTVGFLTATGVPALGLAVAWAATQGGVGLWLRWTWAMVSRPEIQVDLALLTVCCTVLAFHWMTTYQPRVSASRAALIYLFEPVFAATCSILWRMEDLTARLVMGGVLILGGNLLVELPGWFRGRRPDGGRESSPSAATTAVRPGEPQ
jgi:drug/metabolite transporter (DMT)-like permease